MDNNERGRLITADGKRLNDIEAIKALLSREDDAAILRTLRMLGEHDPDNLLRLRRISEEMSNMIRLAQMGDVINEPPTISTDKKLLDDVMTFNAFFSEEDDAEMLRKIKALAEIDSSNLVRLRRLSNDMVDVIIKNELAEYALRPHEGDSGHWMAYLLSAGNDDTEWERRLEALSATRPDVAEMIGEITEAIISVWTDENMA